MKRDIVVRIVTRLRTGRPRTLTSYLGRGRVYSLIHSFRIGSGAYLVSYLIGAGVCYTGVKWPGREADS